MGISGPRYLGPVLEAVVWSLLSLSTVVFALRMYCRQFLVRKIGSDDWIMMVALGVLWGIGVINHIQVETGTGTHMADLPKPSGPPDPAALENFQKSFARTLKAWYTYQLMYLIALFFVKISILAFYRRLSPKKSYQYSIWAVAGVVTIYTIVMVFVNAFECDTPSDAWNPKTWPKGCHDLNPIYYGQAAFNIVSDIVILVLPIPTLLSLQVNKTKRVMLLLIFSVGSISVIASIVRINALYIWHHSMDKPYDGAWILLWSQVEMNAAVLSASAPALKPLVANIVGGTSFFTSRYGGRSTQGYTQQSAKSGAGGGVALRSYNTERGEKEVGNETHMTTEIRGKGTMCSESEENIITETKREFGGGGIYRTTEVAVDVESQSVRTDNGRVSTGGRY